VLSTFDADKCLALARRLAPNRTWQVPTLVAIDPDRCCLKANDDPRAKYLQTPIRQWWESVTSKPADEDLAVQRRMIQKRLELVAMFHRTGVPLLAGTDMGVPWVYPGFSLHDELAWFVRAGLTPAEALRTATLNPARYFDRTDDLGSISAGKLADLVLLEANPLSDIGNTRRIRAVVADGQLFDRSALDHLLSDIAERRQKAAGLN
jgi:imidazolonepropionase-like amidohydrolase